MVVNTAAHIFLRKPEFVYFLNNGRLRVLSSRVVPGTHVNQKVFAAGISVEPTDASNCIIIGLSENWKKSAPHPLSSRGDIIWLGVDCVTSAMAVKQIDEEPLKRLSEVAPTLYFSSPVEAEWQRWVSDESVANHIDAAQLLLMHSGQRQFTRPQLQSEELKEIARSILGFESTTNAESHLVSKFFSNVEFLASAVGRKRSSIAAPFLVFKGWMELSQVPNDVSETDSVFRLLDSQIAKLPESRLTKEALTELKMVSRLRSLERKYPQHFSNQLRTLLMSVVIDSGYKITGDVFGIDEFRRYSQLIENFEGRQCAQLYTLYVACSLGMDRIYSELNQATSDAETGSTAEVESPTDEVTEGND